ncbi:hypothetical protein [Streptomyces gibsoniae]|uniref:Gram-positive cocci surface proteins LPxTG domain-containing protein n=1 Tax=Streptomyces gibsoniae TaxID=3075529 RepID=A0ABU2TNI8_9ACTN|nr:hypothetical protein [Streptomyces sp. DSM 41699]MDT0462477.1 hypothetical protein [Streptomyces sp. DSM 41699]
MFMRLSPSSRLSLFLPCALAAVLLLRQAPAAALVAEEQLSCSGTAGHAFPITTRIHGGPGSYKPGGADQTWFIDLTNTTEESCKNIHPVLVLADTQNRLKDAEPHLMFYGGDRWHSVTFTRTGRQALVGAFYDGFRGFTVAPRRTLPVKVRFALDDKARPGDVVAKTAVVRKKGGHEGWAGESDDYWFQIEAGNRAAAELTGETADPTGKATDATGKATDATGKATDPADKASAPTGNAPRPSDTESASTGKATGATGEAAHPSGNASHQPDNAAEESDKGQSPLGPRGPEARSSAPGLAPSADAMTPTAAASAPQRDLVKFVGGLAIAAVGLLVAAGSLVVARRRR